jgi:hypothetical protein
MYTTVSIILLNHIASYISTYVTFMRWKYRHKYITAQHVELEISGRYEFRCCRSRGHNDIISCTTLLYISVNCVMSRACLLCLRSNPIENLCVACVCLLFLNEKNRLATGEEESQQFLLYCYICWCRRHVLLVVITG